MVDSAGKVIFWANGTLYAFSAEGEILFTAKPAISSPPQLLFGPGGKLYAAASNTVSELKLMGEEVECSVFDDGYANLAGPSDYLFGVGNGQSCLGIDAPSGPVPCRKWFGRCSTSGGLPVNFSVFDDNYTNMVGPADAVFINAQGQACVTSQGKTECRKWFGRGVARDGRRALCRGFGNFYSEQTTLTDAFKRPNIPGAGNAMIAVCPLLDTRDQSGNMRWEDGNTCGEFKMYWGLCELQ